MTPLNRKLAMHNLRNAIGNIAFRRRQAEIYYRSLVAPGIVRGPGNNGLPQSHFPIRLQPAVRDRMCDFLRGRGIDTSKLFPFPCGLARNSYPHASEATDEVVTLPLGPSITLDEVKLVAECVKDGLREFGR
jgi:dTDP-4-amino-4,6-dideoxygalactose transaminase